MRNEREEVKRHRKEARGRAKRLAPFTVEMMYTKDTYWYRSDVGGYVLTIRNGQPLFDLSLPRQVWWHTMGIEDGKLKWEEV